MHRQSGGSTLQLFAGFGRSAFVMSPGLLAWLAQNARRFDVIHVHGLFNPVSSLSARVGFISGQSVVLCPHGTLSRYTIAHRRTTLKRLYFAGIDRGNVERAAAVHFTTDAECDEARLHGFDFGERGHVVPPPLLVEPAGPLRVPRRDAPSALFMSRLHPVKNVDNLLRAWQLVLQAIPAAKLTIAGPGKPAYVDSLRSLAFELGLSDSVKFCGFVGGAEKARLFSEAMVFVLPSYHENFGLAVLEAIAAGVPVVISPQVQLAPFVEEYDLGIVAPSEPHLFAAGIIKALRDDSLHARVATTGIELVRSRYSPDVIGRRLMDMYLSAVKSQRRLAS